MARWWAERAWIRHRLPVSLIFEMQMMKRLLAGLVFSALVHAGDDAKPRPKLAAGVQAIVDLARPAAPEVFAYTIVNLVESGKIPQRELQVELLEDAFHSAVRAVEPVRLIAIPGTPPDTREMYRSKAGELGLDTISLQSRILRNLLTVDRGKARELMGQIVHPVLDPRPCEDALVADIAPYYEIAAAVAQSAFTAAEKDNDAHLQFLIGVLSAAKSPAEVAAFAGAIQNVTFTKAQWEVVLAVIARKLETVGADYRSFAVSFNAMEGSISRLAELARANRIESVDGLLGSFRKYLVLQMTASRCKPDIPIALDEMSWFRPNLSEAETNPKERRGNVEAHAYFDSGDAKAIGERLKPLMTGYGPRERMMELKGRPDIPAGDLSDFLREFALWTPIGSDVDVLHQKGTILRALAQMTSAGPDHDRISKLCVELLTSSEAQRQVPAEWTFQVKSLASAIGPGAPDLLVYLASALASSGTSK
jgi:hypothetical protein